MQINIYYIVIRKNDTLVSNSLSSPYSKHVQYRFHGTGFKAHNELNVITKWVQVNIYSSHVKHAVKPGLTIIICITCMQETTLIKARCALFGLQATAVLTFFYFSLKHFWYCQPYGILLKDTFSVQSLFLHICR